MEKTKSEAKAPPRAGWRVAHSIRKQVRIAAAKLEMSQEKYVERCIVENLRELGMDEPDLIPPTSSGR